MLAWLDKFAMKHKVGLVCMKCDKAITGTNGSQESHLKVGCGCREFVYVRK